MMNRFRWLAIPCILALYFTLIVTSNGVPALRHDWNWPDYYYPFTNAISGWSEQGIGGVNVFVNNYVFVAPLAPIGAVLGPFLTLFAFVFGIATAVVLSARRLALTMEAPVLAANAAAAFALFNPWVYTKIVAGHLPMIAAYAATMALLSEAVRAKPRAEVCALAAGFTVCQLQFFLPALVIVLILAVRHRMWLPALTWIVVGSPTILGVVFRAQEFASTPLTLTWEQTQSVAPLPALLLTGYFAKYTLGFDKLGYAAVALVVMLALAGLILARRSKPVIAAGALTLGALVIAMGLRGPAAGVLGYAFSHVSAFALYRELYDLIAYAAIGYVVLAAVAAARHVVFLSALCLATFVLMAAWVHFSPARQWADRAALPPFVNIAQPQTRYALLPPFQPLRYMGRFAGLDPDAIVRPGSVTPLNEEVPAWPEDSALARYQLRDDWRLLANLSVSEIANRPWFSSANRELSEQLALAPPPQSSERQRMPFTIAITPIPELSMISTPAATALPGEPGAGDVFFGDVAGLRGDGVPVVWASYERPRPIAPQNQFVHASDGWVDARLAFAAQPDLGQPFGGALTTNPSAPLALTGGDEALVLVRGALLSEEGSVLSGTSDGYRWIPIRAGVSRVRCRGLCVVVLEGEVPHDTKNAAVTARYIPLSGEKLTPWLLRVDLPARPAAALRYNARFDGHWVALDSAHPLVHVRIDGCVNGWLLAPRDGPGVVWLVEWVALAQTIAQAAGLLWLAWVFVRFRRTAAAQT